MKNALRTAGVVLAGAALLTSGAASAATTAAPAHAAAAGPRAAVTWHGWRGVAFGSSLAAAHDRLGGKLTTVDPSGGCGDVLTTPTGTLDGNIYRRSHDVGTIRVARGIDYPLGVDETMTGPQAQRQVRQGDYVLHTHRYDPYGTGDFLSENTVVGPHGHTLYFLFEVGDGKIERMGVSVNRHVATDQMRINGC